MQALPILTLAGVCVLACHSPAPAPAEEVRPVHYVLDTLWPALPDTLQLGDPTGLDVDGNSIWVFCRGDRQWTEPMPDSTITTNTVLELDLRTGRLLSGWGAGRFIMPHGLSMDHRGRIWLTDVGLHQVFAFTRTGELLLTLGEARVPGDDSTHFNMPTDVAVARDGSFYVADGYGNSRVVKFDSTGHFLFDWGKQGDKPGQFNIPHAIDLDSTGNVYVADRGNRRLQKFDTNGHFLEYTGVDMAEAYSVCVDKSHGTIISVDYLKRDTIILGSDVWLFLPDTVTHFGRSDHTHDKPCRYHDLTVDNEGNIYIGDILGDRLQKWARR